MVFTNHASNRNVVKFTNLIYVTLFLYLLLLSLFSYVGHVENIPIFMLILQVVFFLVFILLLYFSYKCKLGINAISALAFILCFMMSFILRQCYLVYAGSHFTLALDGVFFHRLAMQGIGKNYFDYIQYILSYRTITIDGLAYPTILYIIYNVTGDGYIALFLLLLLNALAVAISTMYLYKTMRVLKIDDIYSRFFSAVWGYFPFLYFFAFQNLREIFFCMFIILAFYHLIKFNESKIIKNIVLCLLFMVICFFFRAVIPVMILIGLLISLLYRLQSKKTKRLFLFFIFFAFILGLMILDVIILYIFGVSLEFIMEVSEGRLVETGHGTGFMLWLAQAVMGVIGPLPNFTRAMSSTITANGGLLFYTMLTFPFLIGAWHILKNAEHKYYPLLFYVLMGLFSTILTFTALDMRFQITIYPAILCIIAYAFNNKKVKTLPHSAYLVVAVLVIIIYNFR